MEDQFNNELTRAYKRIQDLACSTEGISGISTGFYALDEITSGFQNGNLITIASTPSTGSTSFALSLLANISVRSRIPSLYVSLGMTAQEVVNRMIVNVCEIPGEKIKNGQLAPYEWGQLDYKLKYLYESPLHVLAEPFMHIDKMADNIREAVQKSQVKIVVVDYLQRLYTQFCHSENRYLEVNYFTRVLKSLALELDVPIIIISQINRNFDGREGIDAKRPRLSDLRDSGTIEGDSDLVLFVHRPDFYQIYQDEKGNDLRGMAEIIIAKHRNGALGDVLLRFKKEYARFENPDNDIIANAGRAVDEAFKKKASLYEVPIENKPDSPFGTIK